MTDMLVWLLVLLPPVDWFAAVVLARLSMKHPNVLTLRERAVAAAVLAFVATVAGAVAWWRLGLVAMPGETVVFLLAVALVLSSLPSVLWLVLLLVGRFQIPEDER